MPLSVQEEIFKWVQEFESWKQELFIRAAASPELSETDAERVASMLLGEHATDGARPRAIKRDDLPDDSSVGQPMVIEQITGLRNVNAIEDGQTLAFKPKGVNVVWGANGAGKTGYSRVLKKAGRTLHREEVLTNVYAADQRRPQASLVVKVGNDEHREDLDLDADPSPLLSRICVADSHAGEIYLTKETEVDYVPTTLSSLSRLANGLNAVKEALQRRRDVVNVSQIDLRPFGEETVVADFLARLDASTSEADLRALAGLNEEEQQAQSTLRKRMGEIQAMQAPQLRAVAEREATDATRLGDDLRAVAAHFKTDAIKQWSEREKSLREAREAADLAAKQFEAQPLGEIGSQPWRLLWNAAREYAAHLGQTLPPDHDPAHCPLCMQELSKNARERLLSFDSFVTDNVNAHLAELERAQKQAIDQLPDVGVIRDRNQGAIDLLGDGEDELGSLVAGWLDLAETGFEQLRKAEFGNLKALDVPPNLEPWINARREEVKRQVEIEKGEENEKARTELANLDSRQLLGERIEEFLAHIRALKKVDNLNEAISQTGTSGVSRKIGSLSQELIQGGLEEALKRQLEALEFRDIEVVPKTRIVKGQPVAGLVFKTVEGVPLTSVLSHGEQRRLALAMFLAEMEVRSDPSPVVFDDPTSSIDQEGRRRIGRTLLKLGEKRQVIVFTHELSLVLELQRHATPACEVFPQHVKRLGATLATCSLACPGMASIPKTVSVTSTRSCLSCAWSTRSKMRKTMRLRQATFATCCVLHLSGPLRTLCLPGSLHVEATLFIPSNCERLIGARIFVTL